MDFFFRRLEKLKIDYFGSILGARMTFINMKELEITNFRYKQLQILENFMNRHYIYKIKVGALKGFTKFGDRIFKALHTIVNSAEVFVIFDGKKTYRKTKDEIEMREYGKILDQNERIQICTKWGDKKLKEFDRLFEDIDDKRMYEPAFTKEDEVKLIWNIAKKEAEKNQNRGFRPQM